MSVTKTDERFAEILGGFLYEVLRAGGVQLHPTSAFERIRQTGARMAESIEHHAEKKAIEVAKKLQTATIEAFEAMEKEITQLQQQVKELSEKSKDEDTTKRSGGGSSTEVVRESE